MVAQADDRVLPVGHGILVAVWNACGFRAPAHVVPQWQKALGHPKMGTTQQHQEPQLR